MVPKTNFVLARAGDIDGDGKAELIILRNDRIRIYPTPENGRETSSNYIDHMLNTDNKRNEPRRWRSRPQRLYQSGQS